MTGGGLDAGRTGRCMYVCTRWAGLDWVRGRMDATDHKHVTGKPT